VDTLIDCFRRRHGLMPGAVTGGELRAATELARAKFTASEWTARVP
jgi:lipoate-protein ligase A